MDGSTDIHNWWALYLVCICGGVASDVPVDAADLLHNGQRTSTMRVETFYIMFSGS